MKPRFLWLALAVAPVLATAPSTRAAQVPARLSVGEFAALVERLSEPGGYFDTDNLISNEDSYLHAVTELRSRGVTGGAYLGVGPDQNFSYIAAIRPGIAFILDIRRDNLLEHLLFKSLFAQARNRIEYLCLLFGKPEPQDSSGWGARDLEELLNYVTEAPVEASAGARALRVGREGARASGLKLSESDLATIARFHQQFMSAGLELRLTTFGRPVRTDYPTYRRLLLENDLSGQRASHLASEAPFQYLKSLQERNLIIPVVGDFAGDEALRAIGGYLRQRGERVSVFYTSNVEQYLFRGGSFSRFVANVKALPADQNSLIIRSFFSYGWRHPEAVPGYLSVQLLQSLSSFVQSADRGEYRTYRDLVTQSILR